MEVDQTKGRTRRKAKKCIRGRRPKGQQKDCNGTRKRTRHGPTPGACKTKARPSRGHSWRDGRAERLRARSHAGTGAILARVISWHLEGSGSMFTSPPGWDVTGLP